MMVYDSLHNNFQAAVLTALDNLGASHGMGTGKYAYLHNNFKEAVLEKLDEIAEGGGGTLNHAALNNRGLPDQHPMGAITGLGTAAAEDVGAFATAAQGAKADGAVQKQSGTTQIVNSDVALGFGKKFLVEESAGGVQHLLLDRDQWGVEVGNEEDPLILNSDDGEVNVNWKDSGGTQKADTLTKKTTDFTPLKNIVTSLQMGGIKIGSFATKAGVPTVPSSTSWLKVPTVNDFFVVWADESQGGVRTQYYVTAVDITNDTMTIALDGSIPVSETDILITSFDLSVLGSLVPNDGLPHSIYWEDGTDEAPVEGYDGHGIFYRGPNGNYALVQSGYDGSIYYGEFSIGMGGSPQWSALARDAVLQAFINRSSGFATSAQGTKADNALPASAIPASTAGNILTASGTAGVLGTPLAQRSQIRTWTQGNTSSGTGVFKVANIDLANFTNLSVIFHVQALLGGNSKITDLMIHIRWANAAAVPTFNVSGENDIGVVPFIDSDTGDVYVGRMAAGVLSTFVNYSVANVSPLESGFNTTGLTWMPVALVAVIPANVIVGNTGILAQEVLTAADIQSWLAPPPAGGDIYWDSTQWLVKQGRLVSAYFGLYGNSNGEEIIQLLTIPAAYRPDPSMNQNLTLFLRNDYSGIAGEGYVNSITGMLSTYMKEPNLFGDGIYLQAQWITA